ncbi:helix-turn-helix domain-containing protein [Celeribacter sp.]|uniref:AraC family transcriptional regulator n=1 Tax=Celeribacter sp. TaxID=1890673 RepID=UPI003A952401
MKGLSLLDASALEIPHTHTHQVSNWDEMSEWASKNISPMTLSPFDTDDQMDGKIHSAKVGRIGITRTTFGKAALVKVDGFSGAPVIVATNIQGFSIPDLEGRENGVNGTDRSFVFDLSQSFHRSQLSCDNVQLQLAFSPKLLDEICFSWFGNVQNRETWQIKTRFGGRGTSWHACLNYVMRLISDTPHPLSDRNVRHIEETLCANLLENWAAQAGINLSAEDRVIVPHIIRMAEDYMIEHAADAPTLTEVAGALDISVRNLTMNFKKFRGCTPGQFLREQRLKAAQRELLVADRDQTVSQIAKSLGYIHMGEFAKAYRERFGELPSDTLKRTCM